MNNCLIKNFLTKKTLFTVAALPFDFITANAQSFTEGTSVANL